MSLDKEKHKVFLKSGNKCAFPGCDNFLTDAHQVAHIRSPKPNGPRHIPDWNYGNFDIEENLICLCPTHHDIIDKNVSQYPISALERIKHEHETKVANAIHNEKNKDNKFIEKVESLIEKYDIVSCIVDYDPTVPCREDYLNNMNLFNMEFAKILKKNYTSKVSKALFNDWYKFNEILHSYLIYLFPYIDYVSQDSDMGFYKNNNPMESREATLEYRRELIQIINKYYRN